MKQIQVPYIDNLEYLSLSELERILEEKGEKIYVDQVNWPDSYPYMPSTSVLVARTSSSLVLFYQVRGHDIRASLLNDNEMVCTDSCCEFFVQDPHDGTYYNFEVNCIGTLKAAKRRSRTEFDLFDQEQLSRVVRMTSLPRELFSSSGIHSWQVAMMIPFDLMGFNSDSVPFEVKANFYKCADKSDHPHFVSWNPISTPAPDFHCPAFFGNLIFLTK